jgi:hypothetical protein
VRTDVASRHDFPLDPSSGLPSFDDPDDHVATVLGVGAPSNAEDRHDDASARATPVMPTRERIVVDMPERGLGTYAIITPKRDVSLGAYAVVTPSRGVALEPHRDAMLPDEPLTVGAVLAASLAL